MIEPITINVRHLSQDVRIPQDQVQTAVDLLEAGFPIPFIARYRKEVTKNLNEEALRRISEELQSARFLSERKLAILKTIESAGKLTPDLDKNIREAKSIKRLEDLHLPFKPKRHNSAAAARGNGLEPLALEILEGKLPPDKMDERAAEFINEEKNVKSVADVLLGTGHIIADIFACKAELMHKVRDILYQHGQLTGTRIETARESGGKQQTVTTINVETSEPVDVPDEPATPSDVIDQTESDTEVVGAETEGGNVGTEADSQQTAEEGTEEEKNTAETAESLLPPADSGLPSLEEEVSELFHQLQEAQAEKGLPVVQSQNSLKKKKKAEAKKKLDEVKQRQREHFERQFSDYFNFAAKLRGVPAHRILSLNRGERHKILQVVVKIDEEKVLESVKELCVSKDHPHAEFLTGCLQDALRRGILPILYREIRDDMTEYAERNVVKIFGQNLRNLLLQRPLHQKRVLALDPSHKSGCKAVVLDEFGNLLGHETIYFVQNKERREIVEQGLAEMIRRFGVTVIAIGAGGGSRPVEESVAHMIKTHFADADLVYTMVNKSGSISYSTSPIGKEELPGEDPFVRAAISIGRRLQNPLCELVKIDPVSLGLFHHDIRGKYVKQMLSEVVDSCVNFVGVDVNVASPAILVHVAGLNPMTARRICEYRREHGQFRTREDLKKVPGINEAVYTHAAGFLKITGSENPLDSTNLHPESYELVANILGELGFSTNDLRIGEKVKGLTDKIASEKFGELTVKLSAKFNAGLDIVRDILGILSKLGRTPYESLLPPLFQRTMLRLENLTPGMELVGTILNVTDFGAFVDISLHESGFIHISQMASGYIQDAHEKVIAGNTVRLWVVEVDVSKKRVSLTLLPPGTEKQPQRSADTDRERPSKEYGPRPPRQDRDRREFSDKPKEDRHHRDRPASDRHQRDAGRGPRDNKRYERRGDSKGYERAPKTFVTAPIKKEVKPITEEMKKGKEPMRSFSDLAQLFGRTQSNGEEGKK